MIKRVEELYETYRRKVWSHVPQSTVQMKSIKQVYYCAFFDALVNLHDIVGDDSVSEEQGVDILQNMIDEIKEWLMQDVERAMKEQQRND